MRRASSVQALRILAAGAVVALAAPPALAEDDDERASGVVEEIVVSATYRDTRLMDTPLTISAVTDHDIVNKGIEDIQTLYQSIPGLAYRSNSQTYNTLSVRGITPPAAGGGATVGVYFDNMPITDANSGGLSQTLGPLFDLERVEVLKGPQGTLYGEGAMGGSIRYITKKPDPSGFDYSAQASVEAIGESDGLSYRADAMVNIPLGDHLAARAVVYRRDRQGILDQVAPRDKEDSDTFLEDGMRLRVAWYPTDTIEISGMVNVIDGEYGGPGLAFHCFSESTPSDPNGQVHVYDLPGTICEGQFDQFRRRDPYVTHLGHWDHQSGGYDDQEMYNFSIEWELPFADFTSSTSFFDRSTDYSEETSPRYSIGLINVVNAVFGPNLMSGLGGDGAFYRASERFVQELRLVSNSDSRWQWTVGAYYKDDESQGQEHERCHNGGPPAYDGLDTHCYLQYNFYPDVPIPTQQAIILFLNSIVPGNTNYSDYGEEAVFGEVSYAINDQWEILVGARFGEVSYDLLVAQPGVDTRSNPVNELGISTDITSPKVTLTWRPMTDFMMYLTYSQGYRPGIVNTERRQQDRRTRRHPGQQPQGAAVLRPVRRTADRGWRRGHQYRTGRESDPCRRTVQLHRLALPDRLERHDRGVQRRDSRHRRREPAWLQLQPQRGLRREPGYRVRVPHGSDGEPERELRRRLELDGRDPRGRCRPLPRRGHPARQPAGERSRVQSVPWASPTTSGSATSTRRPGWTHTGSASRGTPRTTSARRPPTRQATRSCCSAATTGRSASTSAT